MNQEYAKKSSHVAPSTAVPPVNSVKPRQDHANLAARRILSAQAVHDLVCNEDVILIDVRKHAQQITHTLPGAIRLDTDELYRTEGKTEGLMPYPADFANLLSATGIQPKQHVVVFDDETGVDATRLLWLLDAFGHERFSLLNGGYEAWIRNKFSVVDDWSSPSTSLYPVRQFTGGVNVSKSQVLEAIDDDNVIIVDTRSIPEYNGLDRRADRGGRIPGAINLAWDDLIDYYDTGEILPDAEIEGLLQENGIGREKPIIVYCQSNRRSAHTYVVLNELGYDVRTYAGSWSEWGNDHSLPIES